MRVAVISLHTSPLDRPGAGDSGGMNVEILSVAERLGRVGVDVDVFTRCAGRGVPEVEEVVPGVRIVQIPAGPCAPVGKLDLPALAGVFAERLLEGGQAYDLIHAHYWLSGRAGIEAKRRWGMPLIVSFHTLGAIKDLARAPGEAPEPRERASGERELAEAADRILAPTEAEAGNLVGLYGGDPSRVRVVPPGVDLDRFRPSDASAARARLGIDARRVVLFAGRLQPHKGADVAIRAFADALRRDPRSTDGAVLVVAGGASGTGPGSLRELAGRLGMRDRVRFVGPVAHEELPAVYGAADALLMPSWSESFGLVALEAQACGVPVVGSAVGGLLQVVRDGETGFLVEGHDPRAFSTRLLDVLASPELSRRLARGAVRQAARFPWTRTVDGVLGVYEEVTARSLEAVS